MAAKIDLRELFIEQHPDIATRGDFYNGNNEFGLWFESGIGDEFKMALFVWVQGDKCVLSPIKLAKKYVGALICTRQFSSPTKSAEVRFHTLNLFPSVSIDLSIKLDYNDSNMHLIYEYVSDPDTTVGGGNEDSEEESEKFEYHDADDPYCDVPQFGNRDQRALHQYVTNFWCSAFVSPDRKMAILTKNFLNGLVLVHSEYGKITTYDYVSHEDCSNVDGKGNKIPDIFPWICDEDVVRFSRPVFEGTTATVYCKRFYPNPNSGIYHTKFTLARLPEF
jgi:hypothetical protein